MSVLIVLAGAVALLLWGIRMVQTGFRRLLGNRLERILRRTTGHRLSAFAMGGGSAFLLQSSTAVVLLLAGFASSGMLALPAALATVLGAEFGASLAAVLLNLDIQQLALPVVLVGYVLFKNQRIRRSRHAGRILIGLGLLLLALSLIGDVTSQVRDSEIFRVISGYVEADEALAMTLMGALTWLIHSTLAAVLIIARFVQENTITMESALFLLLGANIGGAFPGIIAGWGLPGNGRQVVLGNLVFRVVAVLLGLAVLVPFGPAVIELLPTGAFGIVIAHSVLNLVNGLVLLALLPLILPVLQRHFDAQSVKDFNEEMDNPIYLAVEDIKHPGRAMANARNEALHIADIVYRMLSYSLDAFRDRKLADQVSALDDDIDRLHREALNYVVSIDDSGKEGIGVESHEVITFMTNLEHIGDIIESSLMHSARNKLRQDVEFEPQQAEVIDRLHSQLVDAFRLSQAVFTSDSEELARELVGVKRKYRKAVFEARHAHLDKLNGHHSEDLVATQIFMDVLRDMQRICSHLTAIAYTILDRKVDH